MNIAVKNVKEEDWILIKSEAAKNKLDIGEFLNVLVFEYKKSRNGKSNWDKVMNGKKCLSGNDSKVMEKVVSEFRKNFNFGDS